MHALYDFGMNELVFYHGTRGYLKMRGVRGYHVEVRGYHVEVHFHLITNKAVPTDANQRIYKLQCVPDVTFVAFEL